MRELKSFAFKREGIPASVSLTETPVGTYILTQYDIPDDSAELKMILMHMSKDTLLHLARIINDNLKGEKSNPFILNAEIEEEEA